MTEGSLVSVPVRVTYLELTSLDALVPGRPQPEARLERAELPVPEFARFLYAGVGADWHWRDRLSWTWGEWHAHLAEPRRELWYATVRGSPVGYFELDATRLPDVEVAYFGLLPAFMGRGLGGWLLEQAARCGFALGASRVWLHTNTLDGPMALANYLARGFQVARVEEKSMEVPPEPSGPWPGAGRGKGDAS